jgi:DNA polymerase III delta prime subunit
MQQHAFVIAAEVEEGITVAQKYIEKEFGVTLKGNPDVVTLRHGLLSVEDARKVFEIASSAPMSGDKKVVIIAAARAYHEAQNALLKIFEEPPAGTFLFLIIPTLGGLLPTLRSRVQILGNDEKQKPKIHEEAEAFLKASKEKRSAMIKKLATGKDEDERRAHRDEAIALVEGIEIAAYAHKTDPQARALLEDIAELRSYLYDRAAPLRMILEHISLVLPRGL